MKAVKLFISSVTLFLVMACSASLNAVNPRPNIDLPQKNAKLGFKFEEAVQDTFQIPSQSGIKGIAVQGWHQTLNTGYKNGFESFYELADSDAELFLVIRKAELRYLPAAIYSGGGAAAVRAEVTYSARLIDAAGEVVGRATGKSISDNTWTTTGGEVTTAEEAVAKMYEDIASEIFAKL